MLSKPSRWAVAILIALPWLTACRGKPLRVAAPMQGEPGLMLWAWEVPEDLTTLDPARAGVAVLAREVLADQRVTIRSRHQPLRVAPGTWVTAVVRIETGPSFTASQANELQIADAVLSATEEPDVRALQVDFDATASQRDVYLSVLRRIRSGLPPHMPLSITALSSWCGPRSWLRALPADEAVPMFFRMGGPAALRATAPRDQSRIAEPLCAGSVGISTDEAWPPIAPAQRVYVFRAGSWTPEDIARVNRLGYEGLEGSSALNERNPQ